MRIFCPQKQNLSAEWEKPCREDCKDVETERLNRYLCRAVRRYLNKELHTDAACRFSALKRTYRYGDHGIYVPVEASVKKKEDYINETGLATGLFMIFITDSGRKNILPGKTKCQDLQGA